MEKPREYDRRHCEATTVGGATCLYPECDCWSAQDYYEAHPEELNSNDLEDE